MAIPAYPLQWPESLPRTRNKATSQFKTPLSTALNNVRNSIAAFGRDSGPGIKDYVLSSNVTLGQDKPADSGVAAWFVWDGEQRCIAVDRYPKVQDNLQAIYHIVEARRTELRHGGLQVVRQTFKGFTALPAPADTDWRSVFGFPAGYAADMDAVEKSFRELAARDHPDKPGGSHYSMQRLNAARDAARKELGG